MKHSDVIIGKGMIANAFMGNSTHILDSIVFASGVSNSACTEQKLYEKERLLLERTVNSCLQKGHKLIYFSSAGAVYGNCEEVMNEESTVKPVSDYGINKVKYENYIKNSGVNYLILRVSNVIGRNQNQNQLVPYLVSKILGGNVKIYREASRDLVDVEDLVEWTLQLMHTADNKLTINMVSGIAVPVNRMVEELMTIMNKDANIVMINGGDKHLFSNNKLVAHIKKKPLTTYWKDVLRKYYGMAERGTNTWL